MGCTLAELASFIQGAGGEVVAAALLVNAGQVKHLHPQRSPVRQLEERFGDAIRMLFGINTVAFTTNEADYLTGFRTVDEIRNRLAKAREETDRRLRSKGFV